MLAIRQYKSIHVLLIIFFIVFIFNNACFAKKNYPRLVKINIKMDTRIKVKRVNKKIIPLEIKIKNRTFKIIKQKGIYGFNIKARDMTQLSPEFKNRLATSVSVIGLYRVQQLVKKDKKKATELIKFHQKINKKTAGFFQKTMAMLSTMFITDAQAAETPVMLAGAVAAVDKKFMGQMSKAYNNVLNSQSFAYPSVQPGIGGWDLLNEEDQGGGGSSDDDVEDDQPWYEDVLDVFFAIVVVLAPIAAIVFLCTNPFTIASVLMSLAIASGAVTGASIITTTLGTVGDLFSGNPVIQITDTTFFSTDDSFGVNDNSWSWP
ncbi:MAG: hypothetical protein K8S18_07180 [Desulfobacula sp.]|nr:hypothetical protein [Desulfobacula sp.]